MWRYGYRLVDVLDWSPVEVINLIHWLPDTSPLHAAMHGGQQFLGWGRDRVIAADHFDLVMAGLLAQGKTKFDARKHGYPRPSKVPTAGTGRSLRTMAPRIREVTWPAPQEVAR